MSIGTSVSRIGFYGSNQEKLWWLTHIESLRFGFSACFDSWEGSPNYLDLVFTEFTMEIWTPISVFLACSVGYSAGCSDVCIFIVQNVFSWVLNIYTNADPWGWLCSIWNLQEAMIEANFCNCQDIMQLESASSGHQYNHVLYAVHISSLIQAVPSLSWLSDSFCFLFFFGCEFSLFCDYFYRKNWENMCFFQCNCVISAKNCHYCKIIKLKNKNTDHNINSVSHYLWIGWIVWMAGGLPDPLSLCSGSG
jgi:hypothetical protein